MIKAPVLLSLCLVGAPAGAQVDYWPPKVSDTNSTTTPLGAGGVFVGGWEPVIGYAGPCPPGLARGCDAAGSPP